MQNSCDGWMSWLSADQSVLYREMKYKHRPALKNCADDHPHAIIGAST